ASRQSVPPPARSDLRAGLRIALPPGMCTTIFAFVLALLSPTADADAHRAERYATASAQALSRLDYPLALRAAQDGLRLDPTNPWLLYDEGAAFAGMGLVEEAVATLHSAERAFDAGDTFGRASAAYRAGLALELAGRCREARSAFEHYAALERQK